MDHEIILFSSDNNVNIKRINSHKKNQYACTGFYYSDFLKINRLRGEQKYVNMAAAHKNLTVS